MWFDGCHPPSTAVLTHSCPSEEGNFIRGTLKKLRTETLKPLHRHRLSVVLMLLSVLLLVVFQVFWLQKVYQEQYTFLQQNADNAFRNTVFALQDSLIERKLLPLKMQIKGIKNTKIRSATVSSQVRKTDNNDRKLVALGKTLNAIEKNEISEFWMKTDSNSGKLSQMSFVMRSDSNYVKPDSSQLTASRPGSIRIMMKSLDSLPAAHRMNSQIQIIMSSGEKRQSVAKVIKPLLARLPSKSLRREPRGGAVSMSTASINYGNFTIDLTTDSLKINDLQAGFAKALQKNKLPLSFEVRKLDKKELISFQGQMATSPIPAGVPMDASYVATFSDYTPYLLRKITPHALFSLFLITLTAFSFWLIYQNLRQQQRLTELKNDFISNVTHELKTPITTVGVAIEALSNFNVLHNPEQTKEYLTISKNELNRLSMLVDKVLKMAIFEQQALDLRLEPVDLTELTTQILDSMKLQFEKCKASVDFDCTGDIFTVKADRIHLTNVIYNLLENALKYSPKHPEIQVRLAQSNGNIELSVQDKGVGIPAEYQQKIFEKFFRVPTGDVHNVKGHGLGLSYVASIVTQHGGTIGVQSEVGKGSRFVVTLPVCDSDLRSEKEHT